MKTSERLERQIERIHRLLEAEDAEVTWDDHIPDPDNPDQLRQIDVTIRRGGLLTVVECRLHRQPQDVTWIEELMGRRDSLRANAVIAVSASGFTEGAIKKANAKGVILRTLESLSEEEIRNWGREVGVHISSYRFIKCGFSVVLPEPPSMPVTLSGPDGSEVNLVPLFGVVMDWLEANDAPIGRHDVEVDVEACLLVSGITPSQAAFTAEVERTDRDLKLASVVGYSAAGEASQSAYAVVRRFDNESIEIIDSANELGVVVDLSNASLAANEYVRSAIFDFGTVRETKWFHVIGIDTLTYSGPVSTRLRFPNKQGTQGSL